jgi:hypothetical protein
LGFGFWDLLRAIGARDFDVPLVPIGRDAELPWITADLAVLHERPSDLGLEIDVDLLATVGARDLELRVHDAQSYKLACPAITFTRELR